MCMAGQGLEAGPGAAPRLAAAAAAGGGLPARPPAVRDQVTNKGGELLKNINYIIEVQEFGNGHNGHNGTGL